ncbi:MAG: hypothetical protein OQK77_12585 [Psychromonas sp.]|nr:hypothetical protein [Psychromonas sp.]
MSLFADCPATLIDVDELKVDADTVTENNKHSIIKEVVFIKSIRPFLKVLSKR